MRVRSSGKKSRVAWGIACVQKKSGGYGRRERRFLQKNTIRTLLIWIYIFYFPVSPSRPYSKTTCSKCQIQKKSPLRDRSIPKILGKSGGCMHKKNTGKEQFQATRADFYQGCTSFYEEWELDTRPKAQLDMKIFCKGRGRRLEKNNDNRNAETNLQKGGRIFYCSICVWHRYTWTGAEFDRQEPLQTQPTTAYLILWSLNHG